jgi:oligoribonuclease
MAFKPSPTGNLVWVDIETTDLHPEAGKILEVACVVTSPDLDILDQINVILKIEQGEESQWNKWCRNTHTKNGLIKDCVNNGINIRAAEGVLVKFLQGWVERHVPTEAEAELNIDYCPPLCGSGVAFDRKWLTHYMPVFMDLFSYRNVDVSVFYELFARSKRDFTAAHENLPSYPHRSMPDIHRSIEILKRYKQMLDF